MILDTIAASARKRVEAAKQRKSLERIKAKALAQPSNKDFPFERALAGERLSFICEVKKASPSKGVIAEDFPYLQIAEDYERAGASAISVLTEPEFFKGSDVCLREIRETVSVPLLRKDFTVDEYQLYEAKCLGADAILLICALLDTGTIRDYLSVCDSLGLSALVEAHTAGEVESALSAGARLVGVNNRNLQTFEVDLDTSVKLRRLVPPEVLFVAESGIHTAGDVALLKEAGVHAVLIGESFMRSSDKAAMLARLRGESS